MFQALALALSAAAQAAAPSGPHHEQLLNPPELPLRSPARPPADPPSGPTAPPTAGPDVWVYGFLAYWTDGPDALDWDRLTHVAIFNVDLNSDGSVDGDSYWHAWAPEAVALAEPYGVKIHLTLTCFSDSVMDAVLPNPSVRGRTVEALGELVDEYGAHGVNIDCEGMDSYLRDDLVDFVAEVGDRVGEVTVATPAIDWNGSYDYDALAAASDGLFIMGYGYHWSSGDPGPVAPLHGGDPWSDYSLSWSVDDYIYYGAPPDKIILGLPLYGRDWPSTSNAIPGDATGDGSAVVMSTAVDEAEIYGRNYDAVTDTPYYFPDSRSQVWYDDTDSIREKVSYAVGEGLLGVGFWALN